MEGTLQLVSVVGQLVGEEYRQIRSVGAQVAELSDELDTMNAILRMLSEAEEGAVDHFIRVWMKQVRELAYDAEDCIDLYILRIRCRPRDRFLVWSKRLMATLFPRRRLAREIQALRARAVVISERHARYGVSREALLRCSTSPLAAPAPVPGHALGRPAVNDPDQLVGIREQATKLAERVKAVSNEKHDIKLKVFSVVGFGGLGKTTLAAEVCRQLEGDFHRQAQVSVSQAFGSKKDLEGLLKRVLHQIVKPRGDKAKDIEEEDPLGDIHKLDEVALADKLKREDNNGSRIIVTTRIRAVAEACSDTRVDGNCIYEIERLDAENSKKLFLSRASGLEDATLPAQLKAEMDKILKKCGGLPMAIISIASLLASYNSWESKDMWQRVCNSIGSHLESHPTLEGMKQIVTVSFNHLHCNLKRCLMYFSIFPEDYVVIKNRLLKRWIAEGLVAEIRGLTLMDVAEVYYNELVSRSMIDRAVGVGSWYDKKEETCRVHDMVLEVMVSKSLEANFVSLVGGPNEAMSYGSIRRLSIHGREEVVSMDSPSNKSAASYGRKNAIEGAKMQNVRSLSMFDLEDRMKVLNRLGEFTLLRVLDLEDCTSLENKHLRHVCRMYLLKFLSMKGTNINEMPKEVGDLESLETLDVRGTDLQDLPETMSKLEKLEHLQMYNKSTNGFIARRGLKRMKALRTVNELVLENDAKVAEELGELQQLTELRIEVKISNPNKPLVREKLASSLSKINLLRMLNIRYTGGDGDELDFLHDIKQPPRLLQYLRIGGYISKWPDWVRSLNNLVELVIGYTFFAGDNLFDPVCELPNLKYMTLEANYYKGQELVAKASHTFPALKNLYMNFHDPEIHVLQFEQGSMVMLEKLHVRIVGWSNKEVTGVEYLTSIKEVVLQGNKGSPALHRALEQLKTLNESRSKSSQIKVVVQYE